jgi:hypothetical protein
MYMRCSLAAKSLGDTNPGVQALSKPHRQQKIMKIIRYSL